MDDIERKEQVQKAVNRAYFFLKFRPRTEKEVRDYLLKKSVKFYKWPVEIIDAAIAELKEQNFINDKDFVDWFVSQRNTGKPKGVFVLRSELMRLGVEKDIVDRHFEETEHPEEELALKALTAKWNRFKLMDKEERFQKAAQFLGRRGFGFDVIKKTIKQLEEDGQSSRS